MNCKPTFLMVAFAMVLVALTKVGAIQTPDKLTFKMDLCGIGAFSSHQMYTASDGTSLNVDDEMHMTLGKAKKAFAKESKLAKRVTDRTDLFDEAGKKIGERIIFVTGDAGNERTVWLSIKEKFVYKIEAASLRHINDFREWETQPNKSLDASPTSEFLIENLRVSQLRAGRVNSTVRHLVIPYAPTLCSNRNHFGFPDGRGSARLRL